MSSLTRSILVRRGIGVAMRPQSAAVIFMLPFLDRDASSVEHAHAPAAACHGLGKVGFQDGKLI